MKLLVTGASGFVGAHVARIASEQGCEVRGLVRPSSDRALLQGADVAVVVGDITEPASLPAAVAGVDAIVHCAATTSETSPDLAASRRTNVDGTRHLLDVAAAHDVSRFVFISSQSAMPANTGAYGTTKLEAERLVGGAGVAFTTLRPSTVYGLGARGLFAKIAGFVQRLPVIPIIGDGRQRFRPIYVDDVAAAILACLTSERTIGRTYDLGGLDGVSFAEFIDGIGDLYDRHPPKLRLPIPLCMALARISGLVLRHPPLTVDNIIGLTQMSECDIAAAQREFNFSPRRFRDGIEAMRQRRGAAGHGGREERAA